MDSNPTVFRVIFFLSNWRDLHFHEHFQLEISSKCDIKAENSSTLCKFHDGRKVIRPMGSNADRLKPTKLLVQDLYGKKYLFLNMVWWYSAQAHRASCGSTAWNVRKESKKTRFHPPLTAMFLAWSTRALSVYLVSKFSPDRVSFPFSAITLFPRLFTVPLMRMTDPLSRL